MASTSSLHESIRRRLEEQSDLDLDRTLPDLDLQSASQIKDRSGTRFVNFSSNDYLGLSHHPDVIKAGKKAADEYGAGGRSSRLITGQDKQIQKLESELADWLGYESALVFSTGFQMNTGVITSFVGPGDLILADKLVHNSLIQGMLLSKAKFLRYRHNAPSHLEQLLKKYRSEYKNCLIVTESVFSMDGDIADLDGVQKLANQFDSFTYIDEAHALGVIGEQGRGVCAVQEIKPDILGGTFGKAFGTNGAFIASEKQTIDYLINFCSSFIYTTAPSPFTIGATRESLAQIKQSDSKRDHLQQLGDLFDEHGIASPENEYAHIRPVIIGESEAALDISSKLKEAGFWVTAIRPPTVPDNSARLRISLTSEHSHEEIEGVIVRLKKFMVDLH